MSTVKNEPFTIEDSIGLSSDMMQVFEKLNSKERSLLWLAYVDGHNLTLAELQIDDIQGLTSEEKQAKVIDLLTARSGVYHPSAYSTRSMEKTLPARGSHPAGTFWFYQNWDFNTLATIFKQETGQGVFKAFAEHLANPLQLEDFGMEHTFYRNEAKKSRHPAYLFRMSGRDMARIGLLYLNNGRWKDKQIIPENWVKESTQPFTKELGRFNDRGSYGYLWWVSDGVNGQPMYFASGSGGQRICVLPQSKLVFVHMVNTYDNNGVRHEQIIDLLGLLLHAKIAEPKTKPYLVEYEPQKRLMPKLVKVNKTVLSKYIGKYRHRFLGELAVDVVKDHLVLTSGIGKFKMYPISDHEFFPEDLETSVLFEKAVNDEKRFTSVSILNENRKVEKAVFYY